MKVLLHTTDVVTSQVVEILQKAKELSGVKESFEFAPLEDTYVPPRGVPVLSLGAYKRRGQERVVQTYSVKQIMVKGDAISRLIMAFKLLESVPELPVFEYEVVDNLIRLSELELELCGKVLAVDIETKGQVDKQVPAWEQIIALSFYDGAKAYVVPEQLSQDYTARMHLDNILEKSFRILHNGKFDGKYLGFYPDADTMLMHYSLHPAASDHGLKPLAKEYFGAEDWDSGNKQYLKKQKVTERLHLEDGAYAVPGVEYTSKNGYERIPRTQLYEYNCVAEGQLVLTDRGLVPIEDVSLGDKLWDGVEWVGHEGVVYKGTKPVVDLDGLEVTEDHLLLQEDGSYVCAKEVLNGNGRIVVGAHGSAPVRSFDFDWESLEEEAPQNRRDFVQSLREENWEAGKFSSKGSIDYLHLPELGSLRTRSASKSTTRQVQRHDPAVQDEQSVLGEKHTGKIRLSAGVHILGTGELAPQRLFGSTVRQDKQRGSLRAGKFAVGYSADELHEQDQQRVCAVHGTGCSSTSSMASNEVRPSPTENGASWRGQIHSEGEHSGGNSSERPTKRVFDILNAGPRHRFTVSGVIVSNCWDVYWTFWLWRIFKVELEDLEPSPYGHLMELSHMFQRIESPGVRYDVDYMEQLQSELTTTGVQLENELHELVGFPLNPRSPKQLKEYFAEQGYKLASTDANTLKELAQGGNEVAGLISKLRDNNKQNGTYVTGYLDKLVDGRGYPTFKLHASITGRIGGGGPSLLTIPRDKKIKKMVLPDEGHVMVGADASQMELRIMALESQDPWLIAAFQPEAGDFFDLVIQQAYPDLDPVQFKQDEPGDYANLRARIKGVIYGKSFNRGDKAIAEALGVPVQEATKLSNAFIRPGSEFDQWRSGIMQKAIVGEPIINKFGRRFQHELVTRRNQQNVINSAMSFISQSTGNDLLLDATLQTEPKLEQYGARLISTIHDAEYCSVPEENAQAVGELIVEDIQLAGKRLYGDQVAFVADWGIGQNLSEV